MAKGADESNCAVTRGEVDLDYYAERDGVWRDLDLAAPARRALVNAGILTLADLAKADMNDVARLHGMGPKALAVLREHRSDN